jgi:hypothetical protein
MLIHSATSAMCIWCPWGGCASAAHKDESQAGMADLFHRPRSSRPLRPSTLGISASQVARWNPCGPRAFVYASTETVNGGPPSCTWAALPSPRASSPPWLVSNETPVSALPRSRSRHMSSGLRLWKNSWCDVSVSEPKNTRPQCLWVV